MNRHSVDDLIKKDLSSESWLTACALIMDYIDQTLEIHEDPYIKLSDIHSLSSHGSEEADNLNFALNYISSDRVGVLNTVFLFVDGEYTSVVEPEYLKEAINDGFFHPETGEPVSDFDSKIRMVFKVSNLYSGSEDE